MPESPTMFGPHSARNERAIRDFLDGTVAGDRDRVRRALDPEVVLRLPRPTMAARTIAGADNLADFMVGLFAASYRDARATYGTLVCNDRGGAAEWRLQASLASGAGYDQYYCWVFDCRDGRICEIREYIDTHYGLNVNGGAGARAIDEHAQS